MKKLFCLLLGAAILLTMAACGAGEPELVGDKMAYVEGDELVVMLRGNPTTGYEWVCTGDNSGCVGSGESEYVQDEAEEGMVGVGGVYTFRFPLLDAGTGALHFSYERSWEENSAADEYSVTLEIGENGAVEIVSEG